MPRRSFIIIEVCLVLVAIQSATSNYPSDEDKYTYSDYAKYLENQVAAASGVISKEIPAFTHSPQFEAFLNTPLDDPYEQKSKASTASRSFLVVSPKPSKASSNLKDDYFDDEEKQSREESTVVPPGPHYIAHQIPFYDEEEEPAQTKEKLVKNPKNKNKKKKKKVKTAASSSVPDYESFQYGSYSPSSKLETQPRAAQSKVAPLTFYGTKNIDYNTGKSSSTVAQYPAASGYVTALQLPTTTVRPYNFQPNYEALQSRYLAAIASTPRVPVVEEKKNDGSVAQSENVPKSLKNKDCRRIDGPENAENMDCFVCEDAVNKAKYTQCSYASNQQPVNQYAGSSIRYSTPVRAPVGFRFKRSPKRGRYSEDPYFTVSENNRKYFEDLEKEQQLAESERLKDFHYSPYDPDEYESYSESQSAELLKEPGACKKVEHDGMTCTVCKNPKTGGNFEQCSYKSAPSEQKYAYVKEKKYDSDDAPEESKDSKVVAEKSAEKTEEPQKAASSAPVPQLVAAPDTVSFSSATKSQIVKDPIPELAVAGTSLDVSTEENPEDDEEDEEAEQETKKKEKQTDEYGYSPSYYSYKDLKKDKQLVNDDPYDVPEHFAASINRGKTAEEDEDEDGYDEYHYKLFPELNKPAESREEAQAHEASEQNQQDVEDVLAEFAKKDRSNCKKAEKNGMTCFLCVDQNKVQHEECMYVAESKPKPTHVAYHEVQRLKDPKAEHTPIVHEEESRKVEIVQPVLTPESSEISKKKKFFKKVPSEVAAAASDVYKTVVPYVKEKKSYVKETIKDSNAAASAPDSERLEDESTKNQQQQKPEGEEPETPKEIEVDDEEGAYTHETEPIYSKQYGTVLPKYMVEKTEYEKDFDAASGFS
ncbi:hypothetical protein ABEB36_000429 [Hypothenemus hampei]|uniref:Uncharacterized protein n=1 Tax=Hypothenemus hampei TaxID=57062 RepID=A0ABD1FB69_HYPHA